MVTEHSENRSSGIFTKKCPLQSAPVHSSPLLSIPVHSSHIQFSPNAVAPKNPCYNWRMKRAPPCGLNLNHNLTLNRSVPTCRDRIARFQRACLSAAYNPIGVNSWNSCLSVAAKPKLTKLTVPDRLCQGPLCKPVRRFPRLSALVARPAAGRLRACSTKRAKRDDLRNRKN